MLRMEEMCRKITYLIYLPSLNPWNVWEVPSCASTLRSRLLCSRTEPKTIASLTMR